MEGCPQSQSAKCYRRRRSSWSYTVRLYTAFDGDEPILTEVIVPGIADQPHNRVAFWGKRSWRLCWKRATVYRLYRLRYSSFTGGAALFHQRS